MRLYCPVRTILLCSFTVFLPVPASASDEAKRVPQVVVTATRFPVPISQIASSVTVIDEEEIERKNRPTVIELLREVPGVAVAANGGVGQTARVFMRGTNSNHLLVLIDGMVVNDPSDPGNAFDFANLTTNNIERIEVLRGPQSTLYGSQAIGGVIHIITRKGMGAPRSYAYAEYGRYNTRTLGAGNHGEIGNTSYSFEASHYYTSGISALDRRAGGHERDSSGIYTLSTAIASQLTESFTAKANLRYNRNKTEFDSPGGFTRPADDPDPVNDSRQFNGRVAGVLSQFGGQWEQELGVSTLHLNRNQITEYFDSMFNVFFGRQQYLGRRDTIDWVHHIRPADGHVVMVGTEAWKERFKADSLRETDVANHAFFADHQFNLGRHFFMNNGARVDNHQAFGRQFTWKTAPGYRIESTDTRLKATYGTGFKAPSLSQLFDPASGNASLLPETSRGWDAGFEQSLRKGEITFGATVFRNYISQLIGFSPSPPFVGINIGKARTEGVESSFSYRPSLEWTVLASHVYTLSQDRSSGLELLRRPKHQADADIRYQYSMDGDVGMHVHYSGSRRDIDINPPYGRVDVKSYATVDAVANYRLNPAVTLYGKLNNLLDKRYQEVFSYGTLGRAAYAGVKTQF